MVNIFNHVTHSRSKRERGKDRHSRSRFSSWRLANAVCEGDASDVDPIANTYRLIRSLTTYTLGKSESASGCDAYSSTRHLLAASTAESCSFGEAACVAAYTE